MVMLKIILGMIIGSAMMVGIIVVSVLIAKHIDMIEEKTKNGTGEN
jgi:hypothetical protein